MNRGRLETSIAYSTFGVCLALLVVNDWFLKGSGIAPGWLTGKLSDFAGMVVAPVVLATLLSLARLPDATARIVAVGTLAIGFVAIKVDATIAGQFDAVVNATARRLFLPVAAHTIVDRTDLVALSMLAIGGWLAGRLAPDRLFRRSGALLVGLLVCAATTPSQMRLAPHWGLADQEQGNLWGARVTSGAVIVQFGRRSKDGAFEVGVELAAHDGGLTFNAQDLFLELPSERVMAQVPEEMAATVRVPMGETASLRYYFRPHTTNWPTGTRGALHLTIIDGDRPRPLRVDLSFDERIVPWRAVPALR